MFTYQPTHPESVCTGIEPEGFSWLGLPVISVIDGGAWARLLETPLYTRLIPLEQTSGIRANGLSYRLFPIQMRLA